MQKRGSELKVGDVMLLWCGAKRISYFKPYSNPPPALADIVVPGTRFAYWQRGPGRSDGGITVFPDDVFEVDGAEEARP